MTNETEAAFDEASEFVSSGRLTNVTQEEQLELYGLYSVVKKGTAPNQAPSAFLDPTGFAKWTAWHSSSHLEREEAMKEYTQLVKSLQNAPASKSSGQKQGSLFGKQVSSGFDVAPENEEDATEHFDICYWAAVGNISAVIQCLRTQGVSPDYKDQDGLTALMRAVDRNEFEVVDVLVEAGADINAVDEEGQTALHYAACCDHSEMVGLLLSHGARTDISDVHGDDALALASDETKKVVDEVRTRKWRRKSTPFKQGGLFSSYAPTVASVSTRMCLGATFIGFAAIAIAYYRLRK
ncbi:Acyl-coA-binding protein [Gracilaria domingensis]|nr:Acyl-coA-binding protein [Gracilaria domingensis]